jgi:flagella basal body P-ring formation protein FlgA
MKFRTTKSGSQVAAALGALAILAAQNCAGAVEAEQSVRLLLESETTRLPGRVEVEIGRIDERVKLAPCANPEPFIPGGSRLWGKTMLGVRCREGAQWSVLVPVQIKVFALAPVATRPLAQGMGLAEEDYRMEEVELTREAPGILNDPAAVADQIITRNIATGAPLRRDHFRPRPVVAPGDQVKLVYIGPGFTASSQGKALHAGLDGQAVRVQSESGKIVSGIARAGRVVEMKF